jgi:diacylglycerol O-acyltransferase
VKQLSPQDASFLYVETSTAPMAGASITIYDPSTAPGGFVTFKGIMSHIERRLHLSPAFRQKVVMVPFDADYPWWVEDEDFDLEFHIRHIALPKPGDWRQLCIQACRLISRPLDLSKPLWEFYVIEGLDGVEGYPPGCFALLSKIHHAAIDGVSGAELTAAIHDLTPEAPPPPGPDQPWKGESVPTDFELLGRSAWQNATQPWRVMEAFARSVPAANLGWMSGLSGPAPSAAAVVPRTRFNGVVSAHRVADGIAMSLDEIRTLRQMVPGATVNDVIVCIVGGALRYYLHDKDELPAETLTAMCPISTRSESDRGTGGNQVSAMFVPLHTGEADAKARLAAVHESTNDAKEIANAVGAAALTDLNQFVPAATAALAGRMSASMAIDNQAASPPYNTVVTNVPGPQQDLYMAGARAVTIYGLGMVHNNMGLMNAIMSYRGQITITATACRDMMPDPAFYAACLQRSLDDLRVAAKSGSRKRR